MARGILSTEGGMNQSAILDPSWIMPAFLATGLAKSLCTIQSPTNVNGEPSIGSFGVPDGTYSNVTGLVGIQCMDAPKGTGEGIASNEIKTPTSTSSVERRHMLLGGWYPVLAQQSNWGWIGWRALITGPDAVTLTYDLMGAESDSQGIMTRLELQRESI